MKDQQNIIGHSRIISFFERAIAAGMVAHAYVFVGPSRVGKRTVAEWAAGKLVEGEGNRPHPDIVRVKRAVDEKTGKLKRDISIAQMRQLIWFMSTAPFHVGKKVAIIEEAETLSLEATNALLKTLEEPTASSVLILIAEHLERLPETVTSRCQVVRFRSLTTAIIAEGLRARGVEAALADELSCDAGGMPGVAVEWAEESDARAEWKAARAQFEKLVGASLAERFKFAEKVSKSAEAREAVGEMLGRWIEAGRAMLLGFHPHPGPLPPKAGEGIVGAIDRMREARAMIRENVGVKLALEWVLMSL